MSFSFLQSLFLSNLLFKFALTSLNLPWHLQNTLFPGNDINVLPVWAEGVHGKGVTVCILDDGIDFDHPDLKGALRPDLSRDFNALKADRLPEPRNDADNHGTRCAGQIAARPDGICGGSGVAPEATVSAIRLLGGRINAEKEASAITFHNDQNDIYNCSWGPADDGRSIEGPNRQVLQAFVSGLVEGRQGRGSIFVFAVGNGGLAIDNCNFDGYANGAFSITIGAIAADNSTPTYMEECSAMFAVTYSSGGSSGNSKDKKRLPKISTLDVGGGCTDRHGGTSAAAPLASGVMALALSVRPQLTWRDMQNLLASTAIPVDLDHPTCITNGAGRLYSPLFGFGKIDAHRLVTAARTIPLKNPPIIRALPWINVKKPIEAAEGASLLSYIHLDYDLHWDYFDLAVIDRLERVSISVQVQHGRRGDLIFTLCSPSRTCVPLTSPRPCDNDSSEGLVGWTFSTVAFWDETAILGSWALQITNSPQNGAIPQSGQLVQWRLTLWGESSPAASQKYSKSQFSLDFVNNYFPPTVDYFLDLHGVLANQNNLKASTLRTANLDRSNSFFPLSFSFILFFIICFLATFFLASSLFP